MAGKKGKVLQTIIDISGEISPTLGKTIDSVTDKLDGLNVKALAVGASVAAIAGAAAVGFAKATEYLANLGNEYDKAADQMAASTGLVGDELADLEEVMQNVYGNNFGDSFEDVADGVGEIYRQTKLTGDELQATTEAAYALRDTFGYEITESARAAKAMMTNFGISGEDAMGLIAAGAQNGLDYSGELIDTINEYSVQFAKLGFTADEMFSVFQQGADSGAWNLDKVGDAVKEFSIRSIDGSKTTIHAFESLGLNAEDMMGIFAAGGEDASIAFQGVLAALMDMDDAVERDAIGVELFGTQWEDLGTDAMDALLGMSYGAYDAEDALGKINDVKYDNLDSAIEGIKRKAEVALLPAAESVQQAFMDIAPRVEELLIKAEPVFTKIAECIGPTITAAIDFAENGIGWIVENIDVLLPIVGGLTAAFGAYKAAMVVSKGVSAALAAAEGIKTAALAAGTTMTTAQAVATWALNGALAVLTSPITLVVAAIGVLVAAGIALYRNWDTVKEKALEVGSWLSGIWSNVSNAVSGFIDSIGAKFPIFAGYLEGLWSGVSAVVDNIKAVFRGVIDFIDNVFAGNWSAAWDNIVSIFSNMFGAMVNLARIPMNGVVGAINKVISGINGAGFKIPDWVPLVGGKSFSLNIPKLPMLATGGHTDGVSIAGEAGMETVISYDPAYRRQNLSYWAEAGRMLGADASDFNLGGSGDSGSISIDNITFAPNITISGNADKQSVMEAIEAEYPEFIDMLERFLAERGELVYA